MGRVLLIRRAQGSTAGGQWCLPGGKVEYGATVEETVREEVREETSLAVTAVRFLFYQDSLPMESGRMHCIDFYFECTVRGEVALSDESTEFLWVSPEELGQLPVAFRNDTALLRYWAA